MLFFKHMASLVRGDYVSSSSFSFCSYPDRDIVDIGEKGANIGEKGANTGEKGAYPGEKGANIGKKGANIGESSHFGSRLVMSG